MRRERGHRSDSVWLQRHRTAAAAMATRPAMDNLPTELLHQILSLLSWRQQLGVRRVSRHWKAAVDACLARREELNISALDARQTRMSPDRLLNLLQNMPALRRLSVREWGNRFTIMLTWKTGAEDVTSILGQMAVQRLCVSCPRLQEVKLDYMLKGAGVEVMLRRLPDLRSLLLPRAADDLKPSLLPARVQAQRPQQSLRETFAPVQSLAFSSPRSSSLTSLSQFLTGFPHLRELDLYCTSLWCNHLMEVLAVCSHLQRLAVTELLTPTGWSPGLQTLRAVQLQELDVYGPSFLLYHVMYFDVSDILIACGGLERLRVYGRRNTLSALSVSLPGLTHLDLSGTGMDNRTFFRLAGLLPGLRNLKLEQPLNEPLELTEGGLARGLKRLASLQVLDLSDTSTLKAGSPILLSLSCLSLKALAFDCCPDPGATAIHVAEILRRCPTLAVIRAGLTIPDPCSDGRSIVDELVQNPLPADREVTVLVSTLDPGVRAPWLPSNIRLVEDSLEAWERITGWRRWTFYG